MTHKFNEFGLFRPVQSNPYWFLGKQIVQLDKKFTQNLKKLIYLSWEWGEPNISIIEENRFGSSKINLKNESKPTFNFNFNCSLF